MSKEIIRILNRTTKSERQQNKAAFAGTSSYRRNLIGSVKGLTRLIGTILAICLLFVAEKALSRDQTAITSISGGAIFTVALQADGTVRAWGDNSFGELGIGGEVNLGFPGGGELPVTMTNLYNTLAAVAGGPYSDGDEDLRSFSLALKADGTVWGVGDNEYGQLGNYSDTGFLGYNCIGFPICASNVNNIIGIAAGGAHSLALKADGTVQSWGDGDWRPIQVPNLTNVVSVAAGQLHSLALRNDGRVMAWGYNSSGQLGDGTTTDAWISPPELLASPTSVAAIAAGGCHSIALKTDGTVWEWGIQESDCNDPFFATNRPTLVPGLSNIIAVSAGISHSLALKSDGTVWAWGGNCYGELGDGTTQNRTSVIQVVNLPSIIAISAGGYHSLAIAQNGTLFGWGSDVSGQLGDNQSTFAMPMPEIVTGVTGIGAIGNSSYTQNPTARTGVFSLGSGIPGVDSLHYITMVLPESAQKGMALDLTNGNASTLYPGNPWTNLLQHYNATNPAGPITFANPIAAFGTSAGGTPLYIGQGYGFGVYMGSRGTNMSISTFRINVYDKKSLQLITNCDIFLPSIADTNGYNTFALDGVTNYVPGLTSYIQHGIGIFYPNITYDPFYLQHVCTSDQYCYVVCGMGWTNNPDGSATVPISWLASNTNQAYWTPLYVMNFDPRPAWRSAAIDQPHFDGQLLPSSYEGKSSQELTNLTLRAVMTNTVCLTNNPAYTNLDQSPELRRHPTLDAFVKNMQGDPIALARYVINEIELTDALGDDSSQQAPTLTINLSSVNRSALDTFLEGQGSPLEQCELLVYFLREAGYPAAYVYPTNSNLLMLDSELSKLLHMQVKGALNPTTALPYTTNSLIIVNYPWVVANIGTNCVHIFPWLKDTEVIEGLNLYDYMPTQYNSGFKWAHDYIYDMTNIMGLSTSSDLPSTLFPAFIEQSLSQNYPGLSIDDFGVKISNRKHEYTDSSRIIMGRDPAFRRRTGCACGSF